MSDKKDFLGSVNWNRVDGMTMYAIKAMTYLTWASKRFNPANDMARWDSAAKYAAKVMNFKQQPQMVIILTTVLILTMSTTGALSGHQGLWKMI